MAGFGTAAAQLTIDGAQLLVHENCSDCLDDPEVRFGQAAGNPGDGDLFGFALAAGDFDGNGMHDLAVGIPGKTVSGAAAAGAFMVFRGQEAGLSSALDTDNEQTWSQDVTDVSDFSQAGDEMGFALAAGDFNADGLTDLAVRRHLVLVFDGALRHGGFVVGNPTSRKK
jgi:hypothetical protein